MSQMSDLINLEGQSAYLLRRNRFQNKQVWEQEDQEFGVKMLTKRPCGGRGRRGWKAAENMSADPEGKVQAVVINLNERNHHGNEGWKKTGEVRELNPGVSSV